MESIYIELALYGIKNECARTDTVFLPISEVCNDTVSHVDYEPLLSIMDANQITCKTCLKEHKFNKNVVIGDLRSFVENLIFSEFSELVLYLLGPSIATTVLIVSVVMCCQIVARKSVAPSSGDFRRRSAPR